MKYIFNKVFYIFESVFFHLEKTTPTANRTAEKQMYVVDASFSQQLRMKCRAHRHIFIDASWSAGPYVDIAAILDAAALPRELIQVNE